MAFRFVHTADLHLDSPLRSLSLRNPDLAALVGNATRAAFTAIIDLCLDERVDALLIAGDLYDGDQTSMKTARFLAEEMGRLAEAGILVFKIRGNHDALSRITKQLVLPDTVTVFGDKPGRRTIPRPGVDIAIHGISFAKPQAPESLLSRFEPPVPGAVNIGLLHTSLGGAPGHDVYAPCSPADLHATGFRYWGLGHIHQRSQHDGAATIVMPGIPQGRDINEAGPKSVSLVTVADDGAITVEERRTSIAEFGRIEVDLSGAVTWESAIGAIEAELAAARAVAGSPHLVARLRLVGETPLAFRLRRDADLLQTEAALRGERIGGVWIEKIAIEAQDAGGRDIRPSGDPVLELGQLMRGEIARSHGVREEVVRIAREMLDELPQEARGIGGDDEAAFAAFVDTLIEEGTDEILARLVAGGAEAA
ncbi:MULTISPECIES: metallophosphoesterase family protein [unclassified Aureimonas]|uniref:metallophosphoesterase family protein n=1 Tax=unclassified Aureimonas TaxID=2615206 RepID=UPI0006FDAA33|nr:MULTISPECIES: DNA repair exonuclease [unclassified Aureimonas]KQT68900.1 serine/threonine protein phosphatase [Aureimonas sp. Leaf460]KQT69126.1 serine/threonine protein phosphatase [Aureimonas sp. Leaf427]